MLIALSLLTIGILVVTIGVDGKKQAKTGDTKVSEDASQFVTLTDAVPDAILEIRYFGTYNFVGTRIDGYLEPTALLGCGPFCPLGSQYTRYANEALFLS